jgi:predicted DNA-binding transcriptional regulator AlpA
MLTPPQVAARTGLKLSALAKMRCPTAGAPEGPPFVKIGRSVFYPAAALTAWVEAKAAEAIARSARRAA